MKQNKTLSNLIRMRSELERRLVVMKYSRETRNAYIRIFGWVEEFLTGYGETDYTPEIGQRFIVEYPLSNHSPEQFKNARTVVRRMDEIFENKQFTPCFRRPAPVWQNRFIKWHDKYLAYLRERGLAESTIGNHRRYSFRLLESLPASITSLEELTAASLYEAFSQRKSYPKGFFVATKGLLKYLYENGVTKMDLSICVPKPKTPKPMPSVYSGHEVSKLLASVDRTTSMGKRDYAILMLAARLGLRSSDIVNLSLKDIDYAHRTIEIVQVKTCSFQTFVLNDDVGEAITDYIENGRPQSNNEKIFLGSQAPFSPLSAGSGYEIAHRCFDHAGIAAQGRRRGAHALRMSYATALVAKGVPYAVVQEALGHESPESTKHYDRLRKALCSRLQGVSADIGGFGCVFVR